MLGLFSVLVMSVSGSTDVFSNMLFYFTEKNLILMLKKQGMSLMAGWAMPGGVGFEPVVFGIPTRCFTTEPPGPFKPSPFI